MPSSFHLQSDIRENVKHVNIAALLWYTGNYIYSYTVNCIVLSLDSFKRVSGANMTAESTE